MDENTLEYKVGQRIRAARLTNKMSQARADTLSENQTNQITIY